MCKRGLWCLLTAFLVGASFVRHTAKYSAALAETAAQTGDLNPATAVTLWQFGQVKGAQHTVYFGNPATNLPLIPLGTAPGGVATTYILQEVLPQAATTISDGGHLSMGVIFGTCE